MTIAAKGAVRQAVVSTLERIGRGSCAEIERRSDIADGGSRAALWALHKEDLAHITAWERSTEKSAPAAVWVLGLWLVTVLCLLTIVVRGQRAEA